MPKLRQAAAATLAQRRELETEARGRLRPGPRRKGILSHSWQLERAIRLAGTSVPIGEALRTSLREPHLWIVAGVAVGTRKTAPPRQFGPERFRVCLERALRHITSVEAGMVASEIISALEGRSELDGLCDPPVSAWELVQLVVAAGRHRLNPERVAWMLNRIGAIRRKSARRTCKEYRKAPRASNGGMA